MFSLTCTLARASEWPWIEMAWQKCLDEKNASLRLQGRTLLRRYHSRSINSFRDEFEGWDGEERKAFCEKLIRIFSHHVCGYEGYLINLRELVDEWPETGSDPMGFAYHNLLKLLMIVIGENLNRILPGEKITLFHERCDYDGEILEAFNQLMRDPTFPYQHCFTTIQPVGWEDCIALQPADLMAYENFKEGLRHLPTEKPRERRAIFTELVAIESFVAHLQALGRSDIIRLKELYRRAQKRGTTG
jgi:hypothetical protein